MVGEELDLFFDFLVFLLVHLTDIILDYDDVDRDGFSLEDGKDCSSENAFGSLSLSNDFGKDISLTTLSLVVFDSGLELGSCLNEEEGLKLDRIGQHDFGYDQPATNKAGIVYGIGFYFPSLSSPEHCLGMECNAPEMEDDPLIENKYSTYPFDPGGP